jgi:branched-chain amino acid transport system permease protein
MLMSALQLTLVYVLLAFSVHVAMRAGMFSLAGVAFYGTGGYTAAILIGEGIWTPVAIVAAVAQAALLGFGLSLILGRLRNLYLGMATIACVFLVRILAIEGGDLTGGAIGLFGIRGGYTIPIAVGVAVLVAAGIIFLERGRSGRTLEALRLDEQLASSSGIVVVRTRRLAFTLSSALGGLAGASAALLFKLFTPDDVSFELIVDALTMLVLGGTAAWYGPIIGAAIVAWLPFLLSGAEDFRAPIQALVVVLVMIFVPGGAVSLIQRAAAAIRRGRARHDPRDGDSAQAEKEYQHG